MYTLCAHVKVLTKCKWLKKIKTKCNNGNITTCTTKREYKCKLATKQKIIDSPQKEFPRVL